MKKLIVLTLFMIAIYCIIPQTACAEEQDFDDIISSLIGSLDSDKLGAELQELWKKLGLDDVDFEHKLLMLIDGDFKADYGNVFTAIANLIFSGLRSMIPVLVTVCAIAVLYSFVRTLSPEFLSEGTGKVLYFCCYAAMLGLLLYKTFDITKSCFSSINSYTKQMEIVFPLVLTVMAATGSTVSASVYQPAVAFLGNGIANVISFAVLPLVTCLIIFSAVSGLSVGIKTGRLASFVSSLVKWILGICVTVFTMFLSVQGLTAGMYDGITLRVTKYAIGNSVPIVGGFLRDGVDLFLAAGLLIKNALGVCGIILIFASIVPPLVELSVFIMFLKLAAGLIEPFADDKMAGLMSSLSGNLCYVLAAVLITSFMYFLTVMLIVFTGGALI